MNAAERSIVSRMKAQVIRNIGRKFPAPAWAARNGEIAGFGAASGQTRFKTIAEEY